MGKLFRNVKARITVLHAGVKVNWDSPVPYTRERFRGSIQFCEDLFPDI